MRYREFVKIICVAVQEYMGEEYQVAIQEIHKNNGTSRIALKIENQKSNIFPCIYLEEYYLLFQNGGTEIALIAEQIMQVYKAHEAREPLDITYFSDFERVRLMVRGKLVNTEMNSELLVHVPHREFLDLSLVYTFAVALDSGGESSVQISNEHLALWHIGEPELFQTVKSYMEETDDAELLRMDEVLSKMMELDMAGEQDMSEDIPTFYIATNGARVHGAVEMLDDHFLRKAAGYLGTDFMILPSSIHELLFLPISEEPARPEPLAVIVRDINRKYVSKDEILSDHVYRYSRHNGEVTIAA